MSVASPTVSQQPERTPVSRKNWYNTRPKRMRGLNPTVRTSDQVSIEMGLANNRLLNSCAYVNEEGVAEVATP